MLTKKDVKKINWFIKEVGELKHEASKSYATMFIYKALDTAVSKIGWGFAELSPIADIYTRDAMTENVSKKNAKLFFGKKGKK